MRLFRLFYKGIVRRVTKSIFRRFLGANRFTQSLPRRVVDEIADNFDDVLNAFELLDLISELPGIIDNARTVGASASEGVFISLMNQYNPGQKALVEQYCLYYNEEYWRTADEPNGDDYAQGMFDQHEAIEQALGQSVVWAWEAGKDAAMGSLYQDIGLTISVELGARGMDASSRRRIESDWGAFASWAKRAHADDFMNAVEAGVPYGAMRWNGEEMMIIGDRHQGSGYVGATRQLSLEQFMGSDQPFWFTESRNLMYGWIQGRYSYEDYRSAREDLYRQTYDNPWSTSAPPGYSSDLDSGFEYRGRRTY